MCSASGVGAAVDESHLPIRTDVLSLAEALGLKRMQLPNAGGDWQYVYAIPPQHIETARQLAVEAGHPLTVIGGFHADVDNISVNTIGGELRDLLRIEHDSFADASPAGGYFHKQSLPQDCLGDRV